MTLIILLLLISLPWVLIERVDRYFFVKANLDKKPINAIQPKLYVWYDVVKLYKEKNALKDKKLISKYHIYIKVRPVLALISLGAIIYICLYEFK